VFLFPDFLNLQASKIALVLAWNNLVPGHLETCKKFSRFAISHKITLVRGDMDVNNFS
jgi:hypothetical protein